MTRIQRNRRGALALLGSLLLLAGGCGDRLVRAPAEGTPFAFSLSLPAASVMGRDADAFALTDAAHVRLVASDEVLLDTTVAISGEGDRSVPLRVRLPGGALAVAISVDLTAAGQVVFQGSGSAQLGRGQRTEAAIPLTPVVNRLTAPDSLPTFTALGDALQVVAAATFVTGDTVNGVVGSWTDDGRGVVQAQANGLVRSLAEGTATLTATFQNLTATTRVRVRAIVQSVSTVPADSILMFAGTTRAASASARDRNGNALSRAIVWQSSNTSVATVDANGLVAGVAPGTATVTAAAEGKTGSIPVTVLRRPVARISVTPNSAAVGPGATVQLTATAYDAVGNALPGITFNWSSSNLQVASVSPTGSVQALAYGSATVTASAEGQSGSAVIDVVPPILAVSPTSVTIAPFIQDTTSTTVSVFNAGSGVVEGLTVRVVPTAGVPTVVSAWLSGTTAPATLTLQAYGYTCLVITNSVVVASTTPGTSPVTIPVTVNTSCGS